MQPFPLLLRKIHFPFPQLCSAEGECKGRKKIFLIFFNDFGQIFYPKHWEKEAELQNLGQSMERAYTEPLQPQEMSGHGPELSIPPVSAIRHILGGGLICWCSWQSHRVITILPASPTGSSGRGCLKYGLVKMIPRRSLATAQICVDLTLKLQRQDTTVRVAQGKDRV